MLSWLVAVNKIYYTLVEIYEKEMIVGIKHNG